MNKKIIIMIIIILLLIFFLKKHEYFKNEPEEQKKNSQNTTQTLDPLYEEQVVYENEAGREGLDRCIEECKGNCVEMGITGKSFCFKNK